MDDLDADTLSQALKQHGLGELLSFAPILRGNWRQNVAVETTTGRYVFRCQPLFEQQFQTEAQAVQFLAASGVVAVPAPFIVDASRSVFPWEYAVMPLLEGVPAEIAAVTPRPFAEPHPHMALVRAAGTLLGHLHALPVQDADLKRFSLLAPIGDPVGRQLVRARETVRTCLARQFLTEAEAREVESDLSNWAQAASGQEAPSFVHGDFQLNNLLVSGTDFARIVGLLDFSTSHFGHPAEDLPRQLCMFLDLDPTLALSGAFLTGYLDTGPRDLTALAFFLLCERLDLWKFIRDLEVDWVDQSLSFSEWVTPYLTAGALWR